MQNGETITLRALIPENNEECVNRGKVVLKLNDKSLTDETGSLMVTSTPPPPSIQGKWNNNTQWRK